MKLKINDKKKFEKFANMDIWVKEEIKKENQKIVEISENKSTSIKVYGRQLKWYLVENVQIYMSILKRRKISINNLTFYVKSLEKKRKLNPKQGEVMK